jgi:putative glutamine amidotransferase
MHRPIIGLILDESLDPPAGAFSRRAHYALRMDYFEALARAGATPIGLPYVAAALGDYLALCDGFVFPGGDYRFAADWYAGAAPTAERSLRRDFEAGAMHAVLGADKPVLGICNGMQVMAGVTGGRIAFVGHDHRGAIAHGDPAGGYAQHRVVIDPASRVAAIYGADAIEVRSAHKEDVVSVGPGVAIAARADDGVIEAITLTDKRFALGVQWHPELGGDAEAALFAALVTAAAR